MIFHGRSTTTTSRPERKDVTAEIERRFKLQDEAEAAERAAKLQQTQTSAEPATTQP